MKTDQFGPTIDGDDVEAALLAHLRKWMPDYLGDAVREKDPDGELWPGGVGDPLELGEPAVLPVREFTVKHAADDNWPADQLPMLLAHSPGFAAPPKYEGDGRVTGYFTINLSAIASGSTIEDTKKLARVYGSAANKVIVQKPDLGGFALDTQWIDLKNFPVTRGVEVERSLMAVANVYVIAVDGIANHEDGPTKPSVDPGTSPGPWPKVKEGGGSADIRPGAAAVQRLREGGHFDPE